MSTWWYAECLNHEPPLRSADEFEQHTYGLPAVRALIERRADLTEEDSWGQEYFARNAAQFLIHHKTCRIQLVNEYGERDPIIYEPVLAVEGSPS